MRRRHKAALAVAHVLVPLAAFGPAIVAAPTAREATSTTSPEAVLPPTSVVEPATEAPNVGGAIGSVGSTSIDEGRGVFAAVPAPSTSPDTGFPTSNEGAKPVPANSVARGPLPVDVSNSGIASWYDAAPRTTASRDYPRGTRLQVCRGAACVLVTVADFGPELWTGRSLDLSADSFAALAPLSRGVVDVTWGVVG